MSDVDAVLWCSGRVSKETKVIQKPPKNWPEDMGVFQKSTGHEGVAIEHK